MAPKVSVIIPLYNAEKYFRECMRSVLSSTLKDIEIIVVNDGSTDNGPEIAKHFAEKDERIRMFSQENSGLSAARNMGMKEARGDYLAFVDSDDWVEKGVLEAMYRVACTHKSDLVIANAQVYDDKDKEPDPVGIPFPWQQIPHRRGRLGSLGRQCHILRQDENLRSVFC